MKFALSLLCLLVLPATGFAQDLPKGLYAFETAQGMKVGAVFGGLPEVGQDDVILSASAKTVCDHAEIHQMKEVDGIMQMRAVPKLAVVEGKDDVLSADGYHLMLMKLNAPLKVGQTFPLVLVYQRGGEKTVDVSVISRQSK